MENGWRAADQWIRLAHNVPSEDVAAQFVRVLLERWPRMTRSIVDRDRWQRMTAGKPKACRQCAATIPRPTASQVYCSKRCLRRAALERSQLRKTAGIIRR